MNSISNNPYEKRRRKLEDKLRYDIDRDPKQKKPPRRKLRVLDVVNNDEEFNNDQ